MVGIVVGLLIVVVVMVGICLAGVCLLDAYLLLLLQALAGPTLRFIFCGCILISLVVGGVVVVVVVVVVVAEAAAAVLGVVSVVEVFPGDGDGGGSAVIEVLARSSANFAHDSVIRGHSSWVR